MEPCRHAPCRKKPQSLRGIRLNQCFLRELLLKSNHPKTPVVFGAALPETTLKTSQVDLTSVSLGKRRSNRAPEATPRSPRNNPDATPPIHRPVQPFFAISGKFIRLLHLMRRSEVPSHRPFPRQPCELGICELCRIPALRGRQIRRENVVISNKSGRNRDFGSQADAQRPARCGEVRAKPERLFNRRFPRQSRLTAITLGRDGGIPCGWQKDLLQM